MQAVCDYAVPVGGPELLPVHVEECESFRVGSHDPTAIGDNHNALGNRADAFGLGMQMHPDLAFALR